MVSLYMKRATESQAAEYRELSEGMKRFKIGKPEIREGSYQGQVRWRVKFPLELTEEAYATELAEQGEPPAGVYQSRRPSFGGYYVGLSLGFYRKGAYVTTPLVDFFCAAFGRQNSKKVREFIEAGGGPAQDETWTDEQNRAEIEAFLGWVEDMEIYGTIGQEPDKKNPGGVLARFGGPVAIGALPGQPEPDYQAIGKGKLRAMFAQLDGTGPAPTPAVRGVAEGAAVAEKARENQEKVAAATGTPARTYDELFGDDAD